MSDETIEDLMSRLPKGKSMFSEKEVAPVLGLSVKRLQKWRQLGKNADGRPIRGPNWTKLGDARKDSVMYPRKEVEDYLFSLTETLADRDGFKA